MDVGFIGLGRMGSAIARNIAKAGPSGARLARAARHLLDTHTPGSFLEPCGPSSQGRFVRQNPPAYARAARDADPAGAARPQTIESHAVKALGRN